ncbi:MULTISPECIES: ATP-binding protein [Lactobacillus]|uniref:ATP-binding protein n=1 Tax=Lactobacillus TaxID=1578 RepID=UPI0024921886|nr:MULTISPECIES: ATP-binding protein [Lactobacillus]
MRNPFNPTYSDVPKIFLDTDLRVNELISTIQESEFARSFFITGVQGSGKTVFLNVVAHKLRDDSNCYHVNVLNQDNLVLSLTKKLLAITETPLQKIIDSISSVNLKGLNFDLSDPNSEYDVILEKILDRVRRLAQVFNELKGENYPIFILLTGLPDLILDIQNESKLTFLLRSEKIYTLPLKNADIVSSYVKFFHFSLSIASQMSTMTKGYSYAFQLLGFLLFNKVAGEIPTQKDLDNIKIEYQLNLFDNAYQKIFTELSDWDRKYLIAVAGNKKLQEVTKILQKDKVFVAQYRRQDIERRLIVPAGYGLVRYTLPYFEEYIRQVQDPNSPYYFGY